MKRSFDESIRESGVVKGCASYESMASYVGKLAPSERVSAPLFVIGAPRSGTTLLGKCLSAHSEIAGSEESLFLLHLWRIFSDLHQGNNFRDWKPLQEYIGDVDLLLQIREFADRIFSCLIEKEKKQVLVDQTPWYGAITPFIDVLYPDARYIHIIRDGRSVARSLYDASLEGYSWVGDDLKERVEIWHKLVSLSKRAGCFSPDRYLELTYEDFCGNPKKMLEEIFAWAGFKYEVAALDELMVEHGPSISTAGKIGMCKDDPRIHGQDVKQTVTWPDYWTREDKAIFHEIASTLMSTIYGQYWDEDQ